MNYESALSRVLDAVDELERSRRKIESMGPALIRELSRQISQAEIARRIGRSSTYLGRIVHGTVVVSAETFRLLVELRNELSEG